MTLLPDVNIWLALTFSRHVHHAVAKGWFDTISDQPCCFCRLTQQGFLRLATNPKVFGDEALSLPQAWQLYDAFARDPRVQFAEEPAGLEPFWRDYTQHESFSPKVWSDAYLAAFARAASFQVISFDTGFRLYKDMASTILR